MQTNYYRCMVCRDLEPRQGHQACQATEPTTISMSAILDATQSNNAHSATPPRKRSRQDSACDTEPSPGSSHADSGSGSSRSVNGGSVENDDNEDSRQGGSQKRARSEGIVESDYAGAVSWSRGSHGTLPLASVESTRQLAARMASEDPSVDSLIPLPVVHRSEAQRESEGSGNSGHMNTSSNEGLIHTAREDLARSMEFDQQMDVLRRSPSPVSHPPSLASQGTSTGDNFWTQDPSVPDLRLSRPADTTSDMDIVLEQRENSVLPRERSLSRTGMWDSSLSDKQCIFINFLDSSQP